MRKGAASTGAEKKTKIVKTRLDPFAVGSRGRGSSGKGKGKGDINESKANAHIGLKGQTVAKDNGKEEATMMKGGSNDQFDVESEVAPQSNVTRSGDVSSATMDIDGHTGTRHSINSSSYTSNYIIKGNRNGELTGCKTHYNTFNGILSSLGTVQPSSVTSSRTSAVQAPIVPGITFTPGGTSPTMALELDISQHNEKTYLVPASGASEDKDSETPSAAENLDANRVRGTAEDGLVRERVRKTKTKTDVGTGLSPDAGDSKYNAKLSSITLNSDEQPANANDATTYTGGSNSHTATSLSDSPSKKKRKKKRRKTEYTKPGVIFPELESAAEQAPASAVNHSLSKASTIISPVGTNETGIALNNAGTSTSGATNKISVNEVRYGMLQDDSTANMHVYTKIIMKTDRGPREVENSSVTLVRRMSASTDVENTDDSSGRVGTPNDTHGCRFEKAAAGEAEYPSMIGTRHGAPTTIRHVDLVHQPKGAVESKRSKKRKMREREKVAQEVGQGVTSESHRLSSAVSEVLSG